MEKQFKAKMLFASLFMLGCTMTFVSCSDDDDNNTPPTEVTAASVYGDYTGTMTTATVSPTDYNGTEEGEQTGTAVSAKVEGDTIYFDNFPIKDIVMSVVGDETTADQIVEAVGNVSYKIGYTPTVNEAKDSVMLALDPKRCSSLSKYLHLRRVKRHRHLTSRLKCHPLKAPTMRERALT